MNAQMVKDVLTACVTDMPCVYLFDVGKITEQRKHYDELKSFKKGILFKWGCTNNLKRRTSEHLNNYGNLLSSTLMLKYFSPDDNVYEAEVENEIREYFKPTAIEFMNYKEFVILDKTQISGARRFYEDVYKKFSSKITDLLKSNDDLRKDVENLGNVAYNLNRECEGLRENAFASQERDKERERASIKRSGEKDQVIEEVQRVSRERSGKKDQLIEEIQRASRERPGKKDQLIRGVYGKRTCLSRAFRWI